MMRTFFDGLVDASERRLRLARRQAGANRGDIDLHRLLMQSVFALEDAHFLLKEIAEQHGSQAMAALPALAAVIDRSV